MKFQKRLIGAATGCLLLGASNAMAEVRYVVVDLQTASQGDIEPTEDFCMPQLVDLQTAGFEYVDQTHLEAKLIAYYLEKPATDTTPADAATLLCFANIFEEQSGIQ